MNYRLKKFALRILITYFYQTRQCYVEALSKNWNLGGGRSPMRRFPAFLALLGLKGLFWKEEKKDVNFATSSRAKDNFIVEVTKRCAPAVVYIEIKDPSRIQETGTRFLKPGSIIFKCQTYGFNCMYISC